MSMTVMMMPQLRDTAGTRCHIQRLKLEKKMDSGNRNSFAIIVSLGAIDFCNIKNNAEKNISAKTQKQ